jgi:hypothetical protein
MLVWLNRLSASALTILLFVLVVAFAASQTFLNAAYAKSELQHQNAYSRLSKAVSTDIANKSGDASDPQLVTQLQKVITPQILQQRLDNTIDQIQNFYQHNGKVPTLDVSDLIDKAQSDGLPVPDNAELQKPIELSALKKTKELANVIKLVSIGLAVVILLLIITLFAIARKRRNYKPLAAVLISLGIMLSVTGGALLLIPHVFNKLVGFNPETNPYGTLGRDLTLDTIRDFAMHLFVPGVALLVAGILLRVLIGKVRRRKAAPDPSDSDTPTTPIAAGPPTPITAPPTDAPENEPTAAPPMPRPSRPPRKIQG